MKEKREKMEELDLTTPSILFSAISLIMLAYTNRFLAYATVIRNLTVEHETNPTPITRKQIENLRKRLYITRSMQIFGVSSLLLCVICTLFIYLGWQLTAIYIFGIALFLLVISLGLSIRELLISVTAPPPDRIPFGPNRPFQKTLLNYAPPGRTFLAKRPLK